MLRKFTVAALCLLLLTSGSFADDNVVVKKKVIVVSTKSGVGEPQVIDLRKISGEDSAGSICVITTDKLDAAGEKLAKLIAKLEASGDVTSTGAAKLNALIEEIGATLGRANGQASVMVMRAPGTSSAYTDSVESYIVQLSGEVDGGPHSWTMKMGGEHEGQAYKVVGAGDQISVDGVMLEGLIGEIKELKNSISDLDSTRKCNKWFDAI